MRLLKKYIIISWSDFWIFDKIYFSGYDYIMRKLRKKISIVACFSLLIWGGFFGFVGAQKFTFTAFPLLQDDFRLDSLFRQLPFVVVKNASVLENPRYHAAAAEENIYQIDADTINTFVLNSPNFESFYQKVRIDIMKFLLQQWYMNFDTTPYQEWNYAIVVQSWDFKVIKDIVQNDGLDHLLNISLSGFKAGFDEISRFGEYLDFKTLGITSGDYQNLWTLFMFKNQQDLRDLWYELISWKSRKNIDREYRRYNIMAAFHNIGNVKLILPGETFNLAHEIHYRPYEWWIEYMSGYATFGAGARMVYGGWLCGVATALFQWTLTNLWLALLEYSAHSTYYRNLFNAEINGIRVSIPGLDATIYSPIYNVQIKNIRNYPIITVFNFGWWSSDEEQMFTLSKPQDRGSFEYIGSYKKWKLSCFTWKVNGKNMTNCYDYVKNF